MNKISNNLYKTENGMIMAGKSGYISIATDIINGSVDTDFFQSTGNIDTVIFNNEQKIIAEV